VHVKLLPAARAVLSREVSENNLFMLFISRTKEFDKMGFFGTFFVVILANIAYDFMKALAER